jgi:hypothetical protein
MVRVTVLEVVIIHVYFNINLGQQAWLNYVQLTSLLVIVAA